MTRYKDSNAVRDAAKEHEREDDLQYEQQFGVWQPRISIEESLGINVMELPS